MNQHTFFQLIEIMEKFDGMCSKACNLCEDVEGLVLLPNEEIFFGYKQNIIDKFQNTPEKFKYLAQNDDHCPLWINSLCDEYDIRPIDCRIFPLFPIFDVKRNTFEIYRAKNYCPLSKTVSIQFYKKVENALKIINNYVPLSWKELYNSINISVGVNIPVLPHGAFKKRRVGI